MCTKSFIPRLKLYPLGGGSSVCCQDFVFGQEETGTQTSWHSPAISCARFHLNSPLLGPSSISYVFRSAPTATPWSITTEKCETCTFWDSNVMGSGGNWTLLPQSSQAPRTISRTREISGRIKSHLVLTLDSQSTWVLAPIQNKEKTLMPAEVQMGRSRRLYRENKWEQMWERGWLSKHLGT